MSEQPPRVEDQETNIDIEAIEAGAGEPSLEKLSLEESRSKYAEAYTRNQGKFSKVTRAKNFVKEKTGIDLPGGSETEEILSKTREILKTKGLSLEPGDFEQSELLGKLPDTARGAAQGKKDALDRKGEFTALLMAEGLSEEEADAVYETEVRNIEYTEAKVKLGKKLVKDKVEELLNGRDERNLTPDEKELLKIELEQYTANDVYKEVVINEYDALQKAKVESWPPKEMSRFMQAAKWWAGRSKMQRVLIGAGIITAGSTAATAFIAPLLGFSGTITAGGVAMTFGTKVLRSGMSLAVGSGTSALYEKVTGSAKKLEALEKAAKNKQNLDIKDIFDPHTSDQVLLKLERKYAEERDAIKSKQFKAALTKTAIAIAGGMATGVAFNKFWNAIQTPTGASAAVNEAPPVKVTPATEVPRGVGNTAVSPINPGERIPAAGEEQFQATLRGNPLYPALKPDQVPGSESIPPGNQISGAAEAGTIKTEAGTFTKEQLNLAVAHKGEGAWNSVMRQLKDRFEHGKGDPAKLKELGLTPDDAKDTAKVARALNRDAMKILEDNKYINHGGETLRGVREGQHLVLDEHNKIVEVEKGATYDFKKVHGRHIISSEHAPAGNEHIAPIPRDSITDRLRDGSDATIYQVPQNDIELGHSIEVRQPLPPETRIIAEEIGYQTRQGQRLLWDTPIRRMSEVLPGRLNSDVIARMFVEEGMNSKDALKATQHAIEFREAIRGLHLRPGEENLSLRELFQRHPEYQEKFLVGYKYHSAPVSLIEGTDQAIKEAAKTIKAATSLARKLGFRDQLAYGSFRELNVSGFLDRVPDNVSEALSEVKEGAPAFPYLGNQWNVELSRDHIRLAEALKQLEEEGRVPLSQTTTFSDIFENPKYMRMIKDRFDDIKLKK